MCVIAGIIDCGAGFGRDRLAEVAVAPRDSMVYPAPTSVGVKP